MTKQEALQQVFGHSAFRPGQEALIDALLNGQDALGIMPTGAGKSVCYQVPALLQPGLTLVVSPLISLMKDQVMALIQAGVPAAYINSSLSATQISLALQRAREGQYKLIYVAPERLLTPSFLHFARNADISLLAVDEAHCVSQWGQDFRPSYLDIPAFLSELPKRPPLGAFTATATLKVKGDIVRLLGLQTPAVQVTGFDRPTLRFRVLQPKDRSAALLQLVAERAGRSGIIYCLTRKKVEEVCALLRRHGYAADAYHAGLPEYERQRAQDDFQFDRAQIMVATNAFGMGIDKSNVAYVIHYNMPRNLESYYQEAGRAGRDGSPAECILLYGKGDVVLNRWMIDHAESNSELSPDQRELLREQEHERLKQMTYYATTGACLRRFILQYFGEPSEAGCGNCSSCLHEQRQPAKKPAAPALPAQPPAEEEQRFAALRALRNTIAKEKGIPAYAVFTDASLREMTLARPKDEAAFLNISGVGEKKLETYGAVFLSFLKRLDDPRENIPALDIAAMMRLALAHWREQGPKPRAKRKT